MGFKTTLLKKVVASAAHIILTYTTTQNFLLKSQRAGPSSRLPRDLLIVGYIKTAWKSADSRQFYP